MCVANLWSINVFRGTSQMLWLYLHFLYAIKAYGCYIWNGRTCIMPVSESELFFFFVENVEWNYENISISERKRDCASADLLDFYPALGHITLPFQNYFTCFYIWLCTVLVICQLCVSYHQTTANSHSWQILLYRPCVSLVNATRCLFTKVKYKNKWI